MPTAKLTGNVQIQLQKGRKPKRGQLCAVFTHPTVPTLPSARSL